MFHACPVKMAKMDAASRPRRLPRKSAIKPVTVIERNPEDRHGLKDVQKWDEHLFSPRAARGGIAIDECKESGDDERNEHAQGRPRSIARKGTGVEVDSRDNIGRMKPDE